ncbi:membrane protein [Candidatus Magnetoovum chiemensis]|nr:membrane protein [Candidatus Magnetoovum chiemensis]
MAHKASNLFLSIFRWIRDNRYLIAQINYIIWAIIMGYWFYEATLLKAEPYAYTLLFGIGGVSDDAGIQARSALSFILWMCTTGLILVGAAVYLIVFAYNIIWGIITDAFPRKWHYLMTSILLLISLIPTFNYMQPIKTSYLTLYYYGSEIVDAAFKFELKIKHKEEQPLCREASQFDEFGDKTLDGTVFSKDKFFSDGRNNPDYE